MPPGRPRPASGWLRSKGVPCPTTRSPTSSTTYPPDVFDAVMAQPEPRQADAPFAQPLAIDRWPDVPTRVIAGADDRFFPTDFQIRVSQDRLGITPDVIPGGHLVALSRPVELADRLLSINRA